MSLTPRQALALALDPALLFELRGWTPDVWQRELLRSRSPRVLLNCCRQAGKSTTVAALALHTALFHRGSLVLLLSKAQRQSAELFRKVVEFYQALKARGLQPLGLKAQSALQVEFTNGSRIISLPGQEANIRSYSGVRLLVIDEAARVADDLYRAVRPMLAVSGGRLVCLSTPFGRRGFFHRAWQDAATPWLRIEVHAGQVPRIRADFLEEEERTLGASWYRQEYDCSFEALEGLVYPGFASCVVPAAAGSGKLIGGIDFGFRDPFAAVWGHVDTADVLWLTGEYYATGQPLRAIASRLPRPVRWHADPSGATEIAELRLAGLVIDKADHAIRPGLAAVTARLETGRLKVVAGACPHLLEEAGLYRYDAAGEEPVDAHNHALDALRYLVAGLDARFLARVRKEPQAEPAKAEDWLSVHNEHLWTRIGK